MVFRNQFCLVRFLLSVNFSHIELGQFLQTAFLRVITYCVSVQLDAFAVIELTNVLFFMSRGSNPARIPTSLCFEFKKRVYVP
jgi:hypothetical protein